MTIKRILLLFLLLWLGTGCGKRKAGPGSEGGAGAILVFGRGADAKKLDPADIDDGESVKVCNQIFETLVTYAKQSAELVPLLATSWEQSEDGKTWTFHLREGVTFHDGTPFDAGAVVFSLDRHVDPDNPYRFKGAFTYSSNYRVIETMEAVDPHTVRFRLKEPSAVFLANLAMFPASIVSPAAVKEKGADVQRNPVGTGPFRFVKWVPAEKIVLEAYPDYWGEKPELGGVIFKPVKENAARLQQLKRGEIHMMDNFSFSDIEPIVDDPDLVFESVTGMNFAYLAMNNTHPPFDKRKVRLAVAHALDKKKLIQLAVFGYGATGPNPMPPSVWGYHDGIEDYPHDPDRAKALLEEAGFPDGFETELWAMPNPRPYMPRPKEAAQIIKQDLAAVGIEAEILSPPWNTYLDKVQSGEHPLCILGWTTDNGDPDNFLWQLLSKENAVKGASQNVAFYRDDEVSEILDRAKSELDPGKRKALYEKAQERIHRDAPMIPLLYLPQMIAHRKEVEGYTVHPIGVVRLWPVRLK